MLPAEAVRLPEGLLVPVPAELRLLREVCHLMLMEEVPRLPSEGLLVLPPEALRLLRELCLPRKAMREVL